MTNYESYGYNQAYDREPAINFLGAWNLAEKTGYTQRTYTGDNAIPTPEQQRTNKDQVKGFDLSDFFRCLRGNI